MPIYVILAICAFLLTLLGTRVTIMAQRRRALPADVGLVRGDKQMPVPGNGGIVVVFALVICLLATDMSYVLVLSMLLLAAIGLLHGMIGIGLPVRILVQVMAIALPINMLGEGLFAPWLSPALDKLATGVVWIWFMNVFSSMDKADGLCAAEAIAIAMGLCLIAVFAGAFPSILSVYTLIIGAALTGFWWWNKAPARIHMGEAGTAPISFILGYLLILAAQADYHYTALILPAYLLTDGFVTHMARIFFNHRLDAPYYYQKAHEQGRSRGAIVRYIIGVNILLVFLALRCITDAENAPVYAATAYMCVFMLLGFFAHASHRPRP